MRQVWERVGKICGSVGSSKKKVPVSLSVETFDAFGALDALNTLSAGRLRRLRVRLWCATVNTLVLCLPCLPLICLSPSISLVSIIMSYNTLLAGCLRRPRALVWCAMPSPRQPVHPGHIDTLYTLINY